MKNTDMAFDDTNLEQQLRATLSEYRVDKADFAEKVKQRIREDGTDGGEGGLDLGDDWRSGGQGGQGDVGAPTNFMRRAAGFLPPFLFPKGMAKFGVGAGSAGLTKAGVKFVPGLAMLPMAIVIMIVVTAFMGLRALTAGEGDQANDHERAMEAVKRWWWRNLIPTIVVAGTLCYLVFQAPMEAVVLLLLASTLSMIAIVGVLSSKGLATRAELASRFGSMILMVLIYVFQFAGASDELPGPTGTGYALPVLAVGTAILFSFGLKKRDGTLLAPSLKRGLLTFVLLTAAGFGLSQFGKVEIEVADVVQWIEQSEDAELTRPSRWESVQSTIGHLSAAGVDNLDLHNWKSDVHRVLDKALAGGEFNTLYALPIQRLGFDRVQDREAWLGDYDRKALVDPATRHFKFRHDEISLLAYDRLLGLTEDQKVLIVDRIFASLPKPDRYEGISDLLGARHMLQVLGGDPHDARLQQRAHEMLLANWTPNNAGSQAAFPGSPDSQDRDEDGELDEGRLTFVWLDTTSDAVDAMAHFGVPAGIDLSMLAMYLKVQAHSYSLSGIDPYSALAASTLAHLRSLDEFHAQVRALPEPTFFSLGIKHRLLLTSILLVAFAIGATLRAPAAKS